MKIRDIIVFLICVILLIGWFKNVDKLSGCDFEYPYRAEVWRATGIMFFPIGGVTGYLNIGEEDETD